MSVLSVSLCISVIVGVH